MYDSSLGGRLKKARGDASLRDFAKKCGISHTHLDSIEKGVDPRTGKEVSVRWETLKKLSIATGYSVHYLTGDTDDCYAGLIFYPDGSKKETPIAESVTGGTIPIPIQPAKNEPIKIIVNSGDKFKDLDKLPQEDQDKIMEYYEMFLAKHNLGGRK